MEVSVKTLFLTNVSVLFLSAGASYYFWRLHRDNVGLLWWSFATALAGSAILIFRLLGPTWPIPGLAATLFVGACLMALESMRRFNGRPAAKARMALLLLAFVAIFGTALSLGIDMQQRVGLLSFALAICAALSARELVRGGKAEPLRSRLPMALVFAVMAAMLATRAVLSWLHSPGSSVASFYVAMGDFIPLANSVGIVCLNIGFMMMANERLSDRYRKRALTDELTELPNRRYFLEQGERLSRRAHKNRTNACILMMDLDHFSSVNDRFGHAGGDQALVAFGGLLRRAMRPTDLVARYGG
jgi:predicted signal transduction protein with EAL and GGDEF domain